MTRRGRWAGRLNDAWLLNFGMACDSSFHENDSQVSPMLAMGAASRFDVGGQRQSSKTSR